MTDTTKVQGWLDLFGAWDPTLAFVLGFAVLPMALVWWWVEGRAGARQAMLKTALLGTPMPHRASPTLDRPLILGSLLFGVGWAIGDWHSVAGSLAIAPKVTRTNPNMFGPGMAGTVSHSQKTLRIAPRCRVRISAPRPLPRARPASRRDAAGLARPGRAADGPGS